MSDPHATPEAADHGHDDHHEGHISDKTFMKVFIGLMIFTALTFTANQVLGPGSATLAFVIIGGIAICKALLVVTFFMHLKIDWKKIIVFIVPTMILAPLMVIVLWPDIVLAWRLAATP
jgi:cytochrome c oxidase subunit 4